MLFFCNRKKNYCSNVFSALFYRKQGAIQSKQEQQGNYTPLQKIVSSYRIASKEI